MTPNKAREIAGDFTGGKEFEPEAEPLTAFCVMVKEGAQVRLSFDVLSTSKVAAQKQHECLCEPGEQCVVYTRAEWDAKRFQPQSLSAMALQLRTAGTDNLLVRM